MVSDADRQAAVRQLYNTYPFPPEPLLDAPPPGYNWRWHWQAAYGFCSGVKPSRTQVRILDAGCGTGVGTEYLLHLNPEADITAIDLSEGALAVAQERCAKSGVIAGRSGSVQFQQLRIEEAAEKLEGTFDLINCVGVLHHLPDPKAGIQALAEKLAPGGIFHIFVYAEQGRWEIQLMQQAIALLQGDRRGDYRDGVQLGRDLFATLPPDNRLVQREKERWSMENMRDANFADMYLHPVETDYTIGTLQELIAASGLEFLGFSNPQVWQPDRLIGAHPDLMTRVQALGEWERYRLIELLDPSTITHYEFFLAKPPFRRRTWDRDQDLLQAKPSVHPCLDGWPSDCLFNGDYQIIRLTPEQFAFLAACDGEKTIADLLTQQPLGIGAIRDLYRQQLLLFS